MRYRGVARGGGGYMRYAAGAKQYGSGRPFPTMGRVDPTGYRERDATERVRREAMIKRIRAGMMGHYASPDYNRGR